MPFSIPSAAPATVSARTNPTVAGRQPDYFFSADVESKQSQITLYPEEHGINRLLDETTPSQTGVLMDEGFKLAAAEVVCLVDDDPSMVRSVGRLLESARFSVSAFSDPETFLEYVAANSVPLVILDIWMEKMTGMELLVDLSAKSPGTRAILILGYDDPAVEAVVKQGAAFAFFIKPFDDDQFLNAVRRGLGHLPSSRERRRRKRLQPEIRGVLDSLDNG